MTDGNTSARPQTEDFTITNRDVEGLIRRVIGNLPEWACADLNRQLLLKF